MVSRTASPLQLCHCFEGNLVRGSKPVLVSEKQRKYYHILDLDPGSTDCFGGRGEVGGAGAGRSFIPAFCENICYLSYFRLNFPKTVKFQYNIL